MTVRLNQKLSSTLSETLMFSISNPLKVCHFISGDLWAGAEVVAWRLLENLHECEDVDLSVILCNQGILLDRLREKKVKTLLLDEQKTPPIQLFLQLQRHLRQTTPQVLHCHRYKENILGYLASRLEYGPATIATQHGMPEAYRGFSHVKSNFFGFCNILVQKHFSAVVAVSSDIQQTLVGECRLPKHIVSTIRNGVPIPSRCAKGLVQEQFVIGSAGRFVPVKDYDLMIRMAAIVSSLEPAPRFLLAGDGPLRDQIQASIGISDLAGRFQLTGALHEMEDFYLGLDVYINTSHHEGIPMTILEAMSFGVPVVACDVGGIREIIDDGVDGFLVPGRDPQLLAEKCLLLCRDRALWKKMSRAARQKIETKFSDSHMAEQYMRLYRQIKKTP